MRHPPPARGVRPAPPTQHPTGHRPPPSLPRRRRATRPSAATRTAGTPPTLPRRGRQAPARHRGWLRQPHILLPSLLWSFARRVAAGPVTTVKPMADIDPDTAEKTARQLLDTGSPPSASSPPAAPTSPTPPTPSPPPNAPTPPPGPTPKKPAGPKPTYGRSASPPHPPRTRSTPQTRRELTNARPAPREPTPHARTTKAARERHPALSAPGGAGRPSAGPSGVPPDGAGQLRRPP